MIDFTRTYVFGDSLFGAERGENLPADKRRDFGRAAPYLVFDRMAPDTGGFYTNLAVPGLTSRAVELQVERYAKEIRDATAVFLECGLNDFGIDSKRPIAPNMSEYARGMNRIADAASDRIVSAIKNCCHKFPRNTTVFLFTLPSFTVLQPKSWTPTPQEQANADTHIAFVNQGLTALCNSQPERIRLVDFGGWYSAVLRDPPFIGGVQMRGFPQFGGGHFVTVDGIHPGAFSQGLLANVILRLCGAGEKCLSDSELLGLWK